MAPDGSPSPRPCMVLTIRLTQRPRNRSVAPSMERMTARGVSADRGATRSFKGGSDEATGGGRGGGSAGGVAGRIRGGRGTQGLRGSVQGRRGGRDRYEPESGGGHHPGAQGPARPRGHARRAQGLRQQRRRLDGERDRHGERQD